MALSARPASLSSVTGANSGRSSSGTLHVASSNESRVEEISAKAEVQANTKFNFQGFSSWAHPNQKQNEPLTNTGGQFETNSSTFVNLLSDQQRQFKAETSQSASGGVSQKFLAKVINAYEETAMVIQGQAKVLGGSLSISL